MTEPVSVAEALVHLRNPEGENALIESLIVAAREHAEKVTGLVLTEREVVETAPSLGRWIDIAAWPVKADGIAVSYLDASGSEVAVPATSWRAQFARRPVRLMPLRLGWDVSTSLALDAVLPVKITVQAGFAPIAVPASIKAAMLLLVGHLYANREGAAEPPGAVAALLRPYRLMRV